MNETSSKKLWLYTPTGKSFLGGIVLALACQIAIPITNNYKSIADKFIELGVSDQFPFSLVFRLLLPLVIVLGVVSTANIFLKRFGFEGFKYKEEQAEKPFIAYMAFFNGCILTILMMGFISVLIMMLFGISF
jgi:hypothetical protein